MIACTTRLEGQGAYCNGQPIKVSDTTLTEGGFVLIQTGSARFADSLRSQGRRSNHSRAPATGRWYWPPAGPAASSSWAPIFTIPVPSSLDRRGSRRHRDRPDGAPIRFDRPITNGIVFSNTTVHQALLQIVAKR